MKKLNHYIKESVKDGKNGHYEEFADEDTGEIVTMWVNDPTPEELAKREEESKKAMDEYWAKVEKEQKIHKELNIDKLEDDVWDLQSRLKDLHREYRELEIDQEEEVGGLYVSGKEAEAEALAQEYGEKFNKNSEEQEKLKQKLVVAKKKLDDAREKWYKLTDGLWG